MRRRPTVVEKKQISSYFAAGYPPFTPFLRRNIKTENTSVELAESAFGEGGKLLLVLLLRIQVIGETDVDVVVAEVLPRCGMLIYRTLAPEVVLLVQDILEL